MHWSPSVYISWHTKYRKRLISRQLHQLHSLEFFFDSPEQLKEFPACNKCFEVCLFTFHDMITKLLNTMVVKIFHIWGVHTTSLHKEFSVPQYLPVIMFTLLVISWHRISCGIQDLTNMFIQCHLVFMTVYKWLPSRKLKESSTVHNISTHTHTHRGNVDYFTCNF